MVGGLDLDLDFEAETLEEARDTAEREHYDGARPTVVRDSNWNVVYTVDR
jgi:hypothetical protein